MVDTRFSRFVLVVNGAIPLGFLAWDALHHQLGADPVNYAIHTTGWLALMFLTISLCVTPLRQWTSLSWLVSFRRAIGVYGFVYAAIHLSIYFWWDRAHNLSSTFSEIIGKPFITYGAAALLLLTPLAITSTNGMIRRLGPKRWGWLHTLVYPATAMAVVHYWLEGKLITWDKKMFAVAVGVLLGYRWIEHFVSLRKPAPTAASPSGGVKQALPTGPPKKLKFWKGQLTVSKVFRETPSVQTFRLTPTDGGHLPFDYAPGQYLNLALDIDGKKVSRSYTIASSPTRRDYCELTVKREGHGVASRHLHDMLQPGQTLSVSAPAGKFVFTGDAADGVVLIAGGVGITPLMSIIRYLTDRVWKGQIDLFFSIRHVEQVIFSSEIDALAQRFANFHPHLCLTGDAPADWKGERGRIDGELLKRFVPDIEHRPCYICGPAAMLEPMRELLEGLNVPPQRIQFEAFVSPPAPAGAVSTGMEAAGGSEVAGTTPQQPAAADDDATAGDAPTATFNRSGKSAPLSAGLTVLEAAEEAGVAIDYQCRAGVCGTCRTKLLSGEVTMDAEDALDPADKAAGYILACQAHATADITVDA